jgi:hypothetical protein
MAYYPIKGTIIRETDRAILIRFMDEDTECDRDEWFPISFIKSITRSPYANEDVLEVADWLLRKKGLL